MKKLFNAMLLWAVMFSGLSSCSDEGNNIDSASPRLVLEQDSITLKIGDMSFLHYQIFDLPTDIAPNVTMQSSDKTIVSCNDYWAEDELYAHNIGQVTITVWLTAMPTVRDSCIVQVMPIEGNGITISAKNMELYAGQDSILTARIYPDDATYKEIMWSSSDEDIAIVDNGKVSALKAGNVIIYAESMDGLKASCFVTVKAPTIEISKSEMEMYVEDDSVLTVKVYPESPLYQDITWNSTDESIATVENGVVTGIKPGQTEIHAELYGGLKVSCKVTVNAPSIAFAETETTVYIGEQSILAVQVYPDNEKYRKLTWSCRDESIAHVENGVVTGLKVGETEVCVETYGGLKASCRIIVKYRPVENVYIPEFDDKSTFILGEELQLSYGVYPENAHNKQVIIKSSDESIASIDEHLIMHAHSKGSVVISIESEDGNARRDYYIEIKDITSFLEITIHKAVINIGGYYKATIGCELSNRSGHTINITSIQVVDNNWDVILTADDNYLGNLSSGSSRTLEITTYNESLQPRFIWIIEYNGESYQVIG